jgi:hypothetical protein
MLARFVRPGAKHLYQLWRAQRRGNGNGTTTK